MHSNNIDHIACIIGLSLSAHELNRITHASSCSMSYVVSKQRQHSSMLTSLSALGIDAFHCTDHLSLETPRKLSPSLACRTIAYECKHQDPVCCLQLPCGSIDHMGLQLTKWVEAGKDSRVAAAKWLLAGKVSQPTTGTVAGRAQLTILKSS